VGGFDDLVGYLQNRKIFQSLMDKNGIQTSSDKEASEEKVCGEGSEEMPSRFNPLSHLVFKKSLKDLKELTGQALNSAL
jgi:hypothetical protein